MPWSFGIPNVMTSLVLVVVIVGYGTDPKGVKFWKVKNSYGVIEGDKKLIYLYLERGCNICNITRRPIRLY